MTLFKELRRRNVFKVSSVYLITCWLVLQIISVVSPYLHLPKVFGTGITIILFIGFPFACIMAWAFELTPDGIKRTAEVDDEDSIRHITGRKINASLIIALFASLAVISYQQYSMTHTSNKNITIAVLPFADMSHDSSQEYFGDGIAEEILNSLAKVKALHVTARTSSFAYKGKDINIKDIARGLGVNYILEGSVRKSGNKLRITAQLINTETDYHLWSETYDRPLADIFAIQDELTLAITKALRVTLMPGEKQQISERTTDNIAAYELYIKARALLADRNASSVKQAVEALNKAISLDANFGKATTELYNAYANAQSYLGLSAQEAKQKHKMLFDDLIASSQSFPEKYVIISWHLVLYGKNYQAAEQAISTALSLNNSNIEALGLLSVFQSYQDGIVTLQQAIKLDPMDLDIKVSVVYNHLYLDDLQSAVEQLSEMEKVNKSSYKNALIAHEIFYGSEKKLSKSLAYLQQPDIRHNRISEYLLVGLYLANGDIENALALVQENINHYPHDGLLADLVTEFMLAQKLHLFTEQQQQAVNVLASLLSNNLQNLVDINIELLIGNYQPILADKLLYQELLKKVDNLSVGGEFKDDVLYKVAEVYANAGQKELLDKANNVIKHLMPWCQIQQVGRSGCPELLFNNGVITDKQALLALVKKDLKNGFNYEDRYLATDARYIMLQDMPEFQKFAKQYVAEFF